MAQTLMTFYRHLKKVAEIPITCPKCGESMTVEDFYRKHAPQQHALNSRKECVFCFGKKHWMYTQRKDSQLAKHVIQCLKQFVQDAKEEPMKKEDGVMVPEEKCPCHRFVSTPHEMWGRRKDRLSEYVGWYDSLLEKPDMWEEGIEFTEASGLGKDVSGIVQRYLKNDLDWFHIFVKHDAFDTFRKAMDTIREEITLLPFWCLCDGGPSPHRHMILACELESSFPYVWKEKVRYDFPHQGSAKKCVKIKDAFHLVRTLVYVSQPQAACDGKIPDNWMNAEQLSHFHINRPLHPHSIASLCTLFPGGLERLLLEQVGNKNVVGWEKDAKKIPDGKGNIRWAVPIHVTGWKFINCEIPLHPRYEVAKEGTRHLTLCRNKKWYLQERITGNSFQSIQKDMYMLSKKQQNMMNQLKSMRAQVEMEEKFRWKTAFDQLWKEKKVMEKDRDLCKRESKEFREKSGAFKMERDMYKHERDHWQSMWESKENEGKLERDMLKTGQDMLKTGQDMLQIGRDMLKTEINMLKSEVNMLKSENNILKTGVNMMKSESDKLKIEVNMLKGENDKLKTEVNMLKSENDMFKMEVNMLKSENDTLKTEVNMLKGENDILKAEVNMLKSESDTTNIQLENALTEITRFKTRLEGFIKLLK